MVIALHVSKPAVNENQSFRQQSKSKRKTNVPQRILQWFHKHGLHFNFLLNLIHMRHFSMYNDKAIVIFQFSMYNDKVIVIFQ